MLSHPPPALYPGCTDSHTVVVSPRMGEILLDLYQQSFVGRQMQDLSLIEQV